jgi:hypothetical protein
MSFFIRHLVFIPACGQQTTQIKALGVLPGDVACMTGIMRVKKTDRWCNARLTDKHKVN